MHCAGMLCGKITAFLMVRFFFLFILFKSSQTAFSIKLLDQQLEPPSTTDTPAQAETPSDPSLEQQTEIASTPAMLQQLYVVEQMLQDWVSQDDVAASAFNTKDSEITHEQDSASKETQTADLTMPAKWNLAQHFLELGWSVQTTLTALVVSRKSKNTGTSMLEVHFDLQNFACEEIVVNGAVLGVSHAVFKNGSSHSAIPFMEHVANHWNVCVGTEMHIKDICG